MLFDDNKPVVIKTIFDQVFYHLLNVFQILDVIQYKLNPYEIVFDPEFVLSLSACENHGV